MTPETTRLMAEFTGYAIGLGALALVLIGGTAGLANWIATRWY